MITFSLTVTSDFLAHIEIHQVKAKERIWKQFNPFTPEFQKWTFPSLTLDMSIDANGGFSLKTKKNDKQCMS